MDGGGAGGTGGGSSSSSRGGSVGGGAAAASAAAAGGGPADNAAGGQVAVPRPVPRPARNIQLKVGLLGDSYVGKTSLMVKYVENRFDEDYIQTLGINFMEKIITLRERTVTFTIFDLGGGENEFNSMIPLVCADASAILFMFDLTRRLTLQSIKEWYRQARGFNHVFVPLLVGTKFDTFASLAVERQQDTVANARKFARAMHAPLIFTSASHSINVQKLFKIVLAIRFNLKCNVPRMSNPGQPIIEY